MNQEQLFRKIEQAWADLQAAYAGLSETEMNRPGVTGEWSVKDILAHVTTWEEEALKSLPIIQRGERPERYSVLYGGIDAFNAQMAEQKRELPLQQVMAELEATHRRLLELVANAPDEQITTETRFRRRLRLDTYSHYPLHAEAIRQWRSLSGL
jgi:uncharacterized protein (TIGR03083 family)